MLYLVTCLKSFIKNNLLIVFSFPIFLNTGLNFILDNKLNFFDNLIIPKLFSFIFGSIFFINLANFLNKHFSFGGKAVGLVIYLTSYFIFDTIFMFIGKRLSFRSTFLIISCFWIILILYKTKNFFELFKITLYFSIYRIYNSFYINDILNNFNYKELNTDVPVQWLGLASMIYENNYYFALENNIIQSQGLLPSYYQALLLLIGFDIQKFQFIQINSYLFLSFAILLIFDLNISKKNKLTSSILLISIVTNNDWLEYLLINSLMIEGIVSFLISVYLINFIKMYKTKDLTSLIFFLCFGGMVLTKNFISVLTLFILICSLFLLKKNLNLVAGFVLFGFNFFYQKIYFSEIQSFAYASEINFKNLLYDFIYFKNLNFYNVINIVKQFVIDLPTTYIVIGFLVVNIVSILKINEKENFEYLIFIFVLFNFIFVCLLYISFWRDIEIESSYRYLISCFHLIFTSLILNLSKFENRN